MKQCNPYFSEAEVEIMEGDISSGAADNHTEDASKMETQFNNFNIESNHVKQNGIYDGYQHTGDSHDDLEQMLIELNFQNEYLKSQIVGWQNTYTLMNLANKLKRLRMKMWLVIIQKTLMRRSNL